jgi:pimeloyl-ACP methyl ester carboxylesterase
LAQALAPHYRVVAPDLPGRGASDWFAQGLHYVVPSYLAACVTLVAHVRAHTLDWIGTSLGGLVGMAYASLPGCPIRKLVLNDVGPTLNIDALRRIKAYVGHQNRYPTLEAGRAAVREIAQPFGPHTEKQWQELCDAVLVQDQDGWRAHYDPKIALGLPNLDDRSVQANEALLWAAFDAIKAKTLVLRGELSDLLLTPTCDAMQKRGPCAQVVEFAGVGHAPTLMQAEQIACVQQFLR